MRLPGLQSTLRSSLGRVPSVGSKAFYYLWHSVNLIWQFSHGGQSFSSSSNGLVDYKEENITPTSEAECPAVCACILIDYWVITEKPSTKPSGGFEQLNGVWLTFSISLGWVADNSRSSPDSDSVRWLFDCFRDESIKIVARDGYFSMKKHRNILSHAIGEMERSWEMWFTDDSPHTKMWVNVFQSSSCAFWCFPWLDSSAH